MNELEVKMESFRDGCVKGINSRLWRIRRKTWRSMDLKDA